MINTQPTGQVVLAQDHSALSLLQAILVDTVATFPEVFSGVAIPADHRRLRKIYPELLPQIEAARIAHAERHRIAVHMTAALHRFIDWQDSDGGRQPLHAALGTAVEPAVVTSHTFGGDVGWAPGIVYQGKRWEGQRLAALGTLLLERNLITVEAVDALAWLADEVLDGGTLELTGRKIAVLGAGAEMAPTRLWLEAGADVLWLDTQPPPASWWETPGMSGRLSWPQENTDLLSRPQEVLATLIAFAEGSPLDLGLYAYAPGRARELRLTASMNAIVDALPHDLIRSVTMLVSPTTPTALSVQDRRAMTQRLETRPRWEAICARLGLLGRGDGCVRHDDSAVTRTVVSIQGASYQAAQYLGKVMQAECWTNFGQAGSTHSEAVRVSANTAAITRTRSLEHPVFTAAFGGAAAFGVETLVPGQSRRINGLLAVRDWLQPAIPAPGLIRIHGGIHTLPYPLGAALKVAAAIGFARSPKLVRGMLTRTGKHAK